MTNVNEPVVNKIDYITYQNIKGQIQSLHNIVSDIDTKILVNLTQLNRDIDGCWKGENATLFKGKIETLQSELGSVKASLSVTASSMDKIADKQYYSE